MELARQERAERRRQLKREERKRRRKARNLTVEVELTKRQSDKLLYVAFKPTWKELLKKR